MNPTNDEVNATLERLERPRIELIEEWQSDAEREGLPVVNIRDSGAPLLDRDRVLKWQPSHMGRK